MGGYLYSKSSDQTAQADEGLRRVEIVDADSIKNGDMREVKVGEGKLDNILVSRFNGKLYATGAYCSHLGAPLANGAVFDDKVMCPYHAATYSVITGTSENGPGRDSLPTYEIVQDGKRYYALVPEQIQQSRVLPMAKHDPNNKRHFVIVGGGAAGITCAETLRYSGFTGKITIIHGEKTLPYDRTMLTKTLPFAKEDQFVLRDEQFLKDADIEILRDKVYSIHTDKKKVTLQRGQPLDYDKLLIATGGSPKKPSIPGVDANHVYTLRTNQDQQKIKERAAEVKEGVAVIGSSFIGIECASALATKYKGQFEIHLVGGNEDLPLERQFGKAIGQQLADKSHEYGIKLHMKNRLKEVTKN